MDLDLETAGRYNLRAALEMLRGVAVAGEISPAQLESCADAAETSDLYSQIVPNYAFSGLFVPLDES